MAMYQASSGSVGNTWALLSSDRFYNGEMVKYPNSSQSMIWSSAIAIQKDIAIRNDDLKKILSSRLTHSHLSRDSSLLSHIDKDNYLDIRDHVATLEDVKAFNVSHDVLVELLKEIPSLEVDSTNSRVRPIDTRQKIYIRDMPEDTTVEHIEALFREFTTKPIEIEHVKERCSFYATFSTGVEAQQAHAFIQCQTFQGEQVKAKICPTKPLAGNLPPMKPPTEPLAVEQGNQYVLAAMPLPLPQQPLALPPATVLHALPPLGHATSMNGPFFPPTPAPQPLFMHQSTSMSHPYGNSVPVQVMPGYLRCGPNGSYQAFALMPTNAALMQTNAALMPLNATLPPSSDPSGLYELNNHRDSHRQLPKPARAVDRSLETNGYRNMAESQLPPRFRKESSKSSGFGGLASGRSEEQPGAVSSPAVDRSDSAFPDHKPTPNGSKKPADRRPPFAARRHGNEGGRYKYRHEVPKEPELKKEPEFKIDDSLHFPQLDTRKVPPKNGVIVEASNGLSRASYVHALAGPAIANPAAAPILSASAAPCERDDVADPALAPQSVSSSDVSPLSCLPVCGANENPSKPVDINMPSVKLSYARIVERTAKVNVGATAEDGHLVERLADACQPSSQQSGAPSSCASNLHKKCDVAVRTPVDDCNGIRASHRRQ